MSMGDFLGRIMSGTPVTLRMFLNDEFGSIAVKHGEYQINQLMITRTVWGPRIVAHCYGPMDESIEEELVFDSMREFARAFGIRFE